MSVLALLLVGCFAKIYADKPDSSFAKIYPLAEDWQVYDDKYANYVPYIPTRHGNSRSMSFWLEPANFPSYTLVFSVPSNTYWFINQKMVAYYPQARGLNYDLDSLNKEYGGEAIFCTFYNDQRLLPLESLFVGKALEQDQQRTLLNTSRLPEQSGGDNWQNILKSDLKYRYTLSIVFILGLLQLVLLKNLSTKSFNSYFSLRSSLSSRARKDENLIQKPRNSFNLLTIVLLSLWMSQYYLIQYEWAQKFSILPWQNVWLNNSLSAFLSVLVAFVSYLIFKYFILLFFGALLNIPRASVNIHYFEFTRIHLLYYGLASPLLMLIYVTFGSGNQLEWIYGAFYASLVFHILQIGLICIYIIKQLTFRSLYLFYYLCICELIPFLIGLKIALFSIYNQINI